ncbi:TetR family transcriptional regulator [Streptomyces sp. BRA346]|uniref:TetR family transcriptional regulator n=1 Tax=Streptomyces sp. BRA346 TaxID=2878199 RepID=UPI0040638F65
MGHRPPPGLTPALNPGGGRPGPLQIGEEVIEGPGELAHHTVERIAAAAGVAKPTVYRRWPSKGALIVDCLLDALGEPEHRVLFFIDERPSRVHASPERRGS